MDFEKARKQSVEERINQAFEKAKASQDKLNAVVTFIDPKEQIEALKDVDEKAPLYGMPIVLKRQCEYKRNSYNSKFSNFR